MKPWWWLLLLAAVVIGACRLRFDAEILDLLPSDEPAVQGLKLYQRHFTNARELIVTVQTADPASAEYFAGRLAEQLRTQTNLVETARWHPLWSEQPGQLTELLACLWLNQPPEVFAVLTNRLAPNHVATVLAEARDTLSTSLSPTDIARRAFDPLDLSSLPAIAEAGRLSPSQAQGGFASADGCYRVIYIQARPTLADYRECTGWLRKIRLVVERVRAETPAGANVVVHYTGRPVFVAEISSQMQTDLVCSITGTAAVTALLFWLAHRRWRPMLWLLTLLMLILLATLALGGLVLGTVSVVSLGFTAVLLGLAVDYAVVHYQEALAHPQMSVPEVRRAIAPSILWAALTTISAFLVLNGCGLPGLAQLGTLVALGVALAALVMVMIYLPPLFPERRQSLSSSPACWRLFFARCGSSVFFILGIPPLELAARTDH